MNDKKTHQDLTFLLYKQVLREEIRLSPVPQDRSNDKVLYTVQLVPSDPPHDRQWWHDIPGLARRSLELYDLRVDYSAADNSKRVLFAYEPLPGSSLLHFNPPTKYAARYELRQFGKNERNQFEAAFWKLWVEHFRKKPEK